MKEREGGRREGRRENSETEGKRSEGKRGGARRSGRAAGASARARGGTHVGQERVELCPGDRPQAPRRRRGRVRRVKVDLEPLLGALEDGWREVEVVGVVGGGGGVVVGGGGGGMSGGGGDGRRRRSRHRGDDFLL